MNPSKINRQKILKKFNIEKYNDQEELIESEPLLEQSSSPYIELQLNSEINDDIKKNVVLSPDITSRLPSVLDYKNAYKDDYFHKISEILNKTPINFVSNKVINISIFNIYKQKHVIPSMLFLLYKNNDKLFFPNFTSTQNVDISIEKKLDSIFDNYKIKPEYIGFLEDDKNIYVFFQYKEKYEVSEVKRSSSWWWATISEIVNYRKILNYEISTYIYNLFVKNPFIYRLFDKNNKVFPIGNTVFYGGHQNYISFISTLGLPKESPTSNLGPYYYFYSYHGAGRRAIWSQNRKQKIINGKDITRNEYGVYDRGGIVRFSIFGNTPKFFLNKESDKDDDSDISTELAKNSPFIKSTLKIRDVDGKWAVDHDIAYIGSSYINVDKSEHKPRRLLEQWAVRDYNQHLPLSFHYINTDEFANIKDSEKAKNIPYEYETYNIE